MKVASLASIPDADSISVSATYLMQTASLCLPRVQWLSGLKNFYQLLLWEPLSLFFLTQLCPFIPRIKWPLILCTIIHVPSNENVIKYKQ
jgi:hypothetical protein